MTKSLSSSPKQSKPPDPIMTSTSSLSKSSLASSAASLSPSTSILLSAATNRTSMPTGSSSSRSSSSYRKGQPPIVPLSSSSSISTSSSSNRNAKLESIIQNFYTKTAQIILQSRIPHMKNTLGKKKLNKWFNITTNDNEKLKEELKFWKSLVKYQQEEEEPPPLVIDIYLETTEPDLLQEGDDVYGWRKLDLGIQQNDVQRILIESWTLSLNHPLPDYPVDLPNLYKRSIVFFRSLHSLVRVLPSYSLYQRLKLQHGEISLGYRLSTHQHNKRDEISLDHALTNVDTIQLYEFNDISTPLGTFKLKLLFREHCKFDTKEDSPLHGIDVEENFFTPTMTKYRMEKSRERTVPSPPPPPVPVFPTASSMTSSAKSRLQSQRGTSATTTAATATASSRSNHYPMTSISSTTASSTHTNTTQLERRISAPLVSPFKSPSLSSSPQTELMFTSHHSRSNTPERSTRPESGSFGRKPEFSSSFEKFFSKGNNTQHSGSSNASASSSIQHHMHRVGSSNNVAAGDGISMTRRWSRTSDHSSINLESEEDEEDLEEFMRFIAAKQDLKLFQQQTTQPSFTAAAATAAKDTSTATQNQAEKEDVMKPLSHFRNIQETHTILSDSMILSQPQLKQQPQQQQQHQQADYSYESSSSSSLTKGLNLPAVPSPLHTTESAIHPTATATTHTRAAVHPNDTFFNRHSAAEVVTFSPLKNRQAPPPPPPPKMPVRQHRISSSGGSGGALDDDDSLVFKMSELSGYDENAPSSGHNSSFYYGSNRDEYLQRLKMATALNDDDTTAANRMRRAVSTGGTPSNVINTTTTATAAAAMMLDSSESSSKSDPAGSMSNRFKTIQQDQGAKTTRRFFYGES